MKNRKFKERITAWLLAVIMVLSACIVPDSGIKAYAAETGESRQAALNVPAAGVTDSNGVGDNSTDTGNQDDTEETAETGDGETTDPTEPVHDYKVKVTAPEGPFYPGETVSGFSAEVTDNDTPVTGAAVTWSVDGNAQIDAAGALTVNESVKAGTSITVTATYTPASGEPVRGTVEITTSVRETITVSGTVKDSFKDGGVQKPIANAVVTFKQTAAPLNQTVEVKTNSDGYYKATLYKGIQYLADIKADNYQPKSESFTADGTTKNFELTTSRTSAEVKISPISGEFYAGDEVNLSVEVPPEWQGETITWEISDSGIASFKDGSTGSSVVLKSNKYGSVNVTAACHGFRSEPTTVNFQPKDGKTTVDISYYTDEACKTEVNDENKVYPKDEKNGSVTVKAAVQFDGKPVDDKSGSVVFRLQKKAASGENWIDVEINDGEALKEVPVGAGGEAKYTIKEFDYAGTYRVIAEFKGEDSSWADSATAEGQPFEVTAKKGQSISFDDVSDITYTREKVSFNFTASLPKAVAEASDFSEANFSVDSISGPIVSGSSKAEITNKGSYTEDPKVQGNVLVKGTVSFEVDNVGEAAFTLTVKDSIDRDKQVYADASVKAAFKVAQKEITVTGIDFAEKTYNGEADVTLEKVTLSGVESKDGQYDDVSVDISENYVLSDVNAGETNLNIHENGGKMLTLTGDDAGQYTLSSEGITDYKIEILKKELTVNFCDALVIKQPYYTSTSQDIIDKVVYRNRETVYSGYVENEKVKEKDAVLAALAYYHPQFTGEADSKSKIGAYAIYASNPQSWPEDGVLSNYYFNILENMQVGTINVVASDAADTEFGFTGDTISEINKNEIYVRGGADTTDFIQTVNQSEKDIKYNDVQYFIQKPSDSSEKGADTLKDAGVKKWPESGVMTIYFKLVKVENGKVIAWSNVRELTIKADSEVKTEISVSANNEVKTSDKIISALTFGLFGNTGNTKADITYSDSLSGIKIQQYKIVGYDDWYIENGSDSDYRKKLESIDGWKDVEVKNNLSGEKKGITFDDGRQVVLSKVVDKVGNIRYATSTGIVVDSVVPDVFYAEIQNKKAEGVYKADEPVNIDIHVSDVTADNDNYSGIADISYKVTLNGKTYVKETSCYSDKNEGIKTAEELKEKAEELEEKVTTITIPADKTQLSSKPADKNEMEVTIWATDFAGNVSAEKTVTFDYDIAAPDIKVTFDKDAVNEKYFNQDRTVTVTVTDAYFDTQRVNFYGVENADRTQEWKALGGNKYELKYTYNKDGDYGFDMSMTDMGGNASDMITGLGGNVPTNYKDFTVDKTKPEIKEIRYYMYEGENVREITPGKAESERFYGNNRIYAVLTLEEHNFTGGDKGVSDASGLELSITAGNKGAGYTEPTHQYIENAGDTHKLRVDFTGDANYSFDMQYTDLAGNQLKADYIKEYFTVDTEKPEAKISVLNNTWNKIIETITFGLFSNHNEKVTISGESDVTSGVQSVQYYKSHDAMTVSQLDKVRWTDGHSLTIGPNQQTIVYGKITDRSGNYIYISTNGFVLDDRIDKPQIDIVTPEPLNYIYNSDVNVKIKVTDPDPNGNHDYSGLKSVYYEVRNNGSVTQSGNLAVEAGAVRQQTVEDVIRVDASKNNSNNVQIYVKAIDNADNSSEETLDMKIDITKPKISVTFDNNAPLNGKYYKETRTATVVIQERNFDPNNVQINITNTDGTKPAISSWSASAGTGTSDAATHTAHIAFAADGDYTFTVDCTDLALNKAESQYQSEQFTIDKTVPEIRVSYDNNSALNGNYYKAGRTATITIREHNFRAGDVKVTATASLNGRSVSAPSVSGWSNNGDSHMATIRFNSDADYMFDISYSDLAGNAAANYSKDSFTVDLTKPEVEITGVKNKSANNGTVAPVIRVSDNNFIASGVKLTLTGANKGRISVDSMISKAASGSGQVITFRNFGENMDDIYTLTASATDKSGNETEKSITFSVNRNGSAYVLSDNVQKLIENGFTNNPQDIVIEEINVDTLEFIELTYSKDGKVVKLEEGKDYTVTVEGGNGQWKKYIYTIKASCFEEEGAYSINIYSEDRAYNTTTNRVKQKSIEFVVDKTPPTMVVSNLDDRGRYREDAHTFTLSVKDNTTLAYVELYLDGKLVHTYKGDELTAEDGVITINVDSRGDYQTIRLIAYDEAGNSTEPMEYSVLVTSSWWIQFYMNKPLFIGVIAGIFISAVIIALIIAGKYK